jgi:hypothetical protein
MYINDLVDVNPPMVVVVHAVHMTPARVSHARSGSSADHLGSQLIVELRYG